MDAGTGELPGAGKSRGADQLPDGAQGAPRILLLGRANDLLERLGDLGCAPVGARPGGECVDAAASPGVVPPLDGLLADAGSSGVGNGVALGGELAHERLEIALLQAVSACQRPQHRESEQGMWVNLLHDGLLEMKWGPLEAITQLNIRGRTLWGARGQSL